jgi:hypothetical protein
MTTAVNNITATQGRGSPVGIATGYGLDDWAVGARIPVESRTVSSSYPPDNCLCGLVVRVPGYRSTTFSEK